MSEQFINDLSFTQSVQIFLENATWLGKEHQVLVTALEQVAIRLDTRMSAQLVGELVKIQRLLFRDRGAESEHDTVEEFLKSLGV